MPIKNRIADMQAEVAGWRQHLHANPELTFDTHETGAFVADKLRAFGCDEVVTGLATSGVVGVIRGRQPGGKTIGLRADMDALPIEEATGLDYASQSAGKMHACGHDGHTAMLLGAAQYLAETRNFAGTCVVIFQPAEEEGGGAEVMVQEGLMERFAIDEVYGMHNWPGMPLGTFAIRAGGFFAAADQFEIMIEGRGGHAAKPHEAWTRRGGRAGGSGAATIASRNVDPVEHVVVSVTTLTTEGDSYNVIPQRVHMKGTIRTHSAEIRSFAAERVRDIVETLPKALGAEGVFTYMPGYPVMVNSEAETEFAAEVAEVVTGQPTAEADPIMGGEDFAYMLEARPGAYILVGNGDSAPVHHPEYNFDDNAIPAGASWWAEIVERRLPVGDVL